MRFSTSSSRGLVSGMTGEAPVGRNSYDRRFLRKGKNSVFLLLPEEYAGPIGMIIAHWGYFETTFNSCLDALVRGEAAGGETRDTTGWQIMAFRRRRALFKEIVAAWLAPWNPDAAKRLGQACDTAGDLSWKRNLIAHGMYAYTILPYSSEVTNCRATNVATGDVFNFDRDILLKLQHDISHLTCDFYFTFSEFSDVQGPFYSSPDEEILRVFRETNHPWHPNPDKRTPPPESSQG